MRQPCEKADASRVNRRRHRLRVLAAESHTTSRQRNSLEFPVFSRIFVTLKLWTMIINALILRRTGRM
jgi:hypothetical protein